MLDKKRLAILNQGVLVKRTYWRCMMRGRPQPAWSPGRSAAGGRPQGCWTDKLPRPTGRRETRTGGRLAADPSWIHTTHVCTHTQKKVEKYVVTFNTLKKGYTIAIKYYTGAHPRTHLPVTQRSNEDIPQDPPTHEADVLHWDLPVVSTHQVPLRK